MPVAIQYATFIELITGDIVDASIICQRKDWNDARATGAFNCLFVREKMVVPS